MNVGILGTGAVGRALAEGFAARGHDVAIGTRDVEALLARTEVDAMGTPPFAEWHEAHKNLAVMTQAEAAAHGELVINATAGIASKEALEAAGRDHLVGKIVIDTSNAIDPSSGFPPSLFVASDDSVGEQLQAAFPEARFVKTWNTMTSALMCNPQAVGGGDHTIPLCGNDEAARTEVAGLLREFGWTDILDLGDITAARGMEAALGLWLRILMTGQTPMFNTKVVR
jgi:predicted dinucleotide-binding enzyme